MRSGRLFLAAYTLSGFGGLVYEVTWTRLLTLHMGHTTAAASTVVAALMGGLAGGSALAGYFASRIDRRQALKAYLTVEALVAAAAISMPFALHALAPVLRWAYHDGASGPLFALVRGLACFGVLLLPALALGATFPFGVRWLVDQPGHPGQPGQPDQPGHPEHPGHTGGHLYAANTTGAMFGSLTAGFVSIPALGVFRTILVGVTATGLSIALGYASARAAAGAEPPEARVPGPERSARKRSRPIRSPQHPRSAEAGQGRSWLAAAVLTFTGVATFTFEIAWTRVFSLIVGPSTYAFAATLTAFLGALAVGSYAGSALAARTRRPVFVIAMALAGAAMSGSLALGIAGGPLPSLMIHRLVNSSMPVDHFVLRHSILVATLIAPTALGLGVVFPLALELASGHDQRLARRFGLLYSVNTLAAVVGSLLTGFVFIPRLGLEGTIQCGILMLLLGASISLFGRGWSVRGRLVALVPVVGTIVLAVLGPRWDRALIASGAYKYARHVPADLDVETLLKAGTLLSYEDGAAATVSVKRLTGDLSLAIDGKVDASTAGDMVTQKALAHLPLLLHPSPRRVFVLGLGSGVTVASALAHPISSVDVAELSPEVVRASRYFSAVNRDPIDDHRTRLIVGDGRSHLALASARYDVIISEPSNPWIAGVAALFTREFFAAARERLSPGGIICQWVHTYDISDQDLRSVVATFGSVFSNATMWLVADSDLLLVGSTGPAAIDLDNIRLGWQRPGVAADLAGVSMMSPFQLLSLFVGGPEQLKSYAGRAPLQDDDRMALEFTGAFALDSPSSGNVSVLEQLLEARARPPVIAHAFATASASDWRDRAAMMFKASSYETAYRDYVTALTLDPGDDQALLGLVKSAAATHHEHEAEDLLLSSIASRPRATQIRIALADLRGTMGAFDKAIETAIEACQIEPVTPAALEQLASLYADLGDAGRLDAVVGTLAAQFPEHRASLYYSAALKFLRGQLPAALDFAQRTIAANPHDAPAYNLLGAIDANLGKQDAARLAFQGALREDARDVTTYTNLGSLELAAGNLAEAARLFTEALSLDPASRAARDGLAGATGRKNRGES